MNKNFEDQLKTTKTFRINVWYFYAISNKLLLRNTLDEENIFHHELLISNEQIVTWENLFQLSMDLETLLWFRRSH